MAQGLSSHTNRIQDGHNRRGVYDSLRHEPPRTLSVELSDPSVAKSVHVVSPWNGTITKIYAAVTTNLTADTDQKFSFGINATTMPGIFITLTSGAAAGITVGYAPSSVDPTAGSARYNYISAGQVFRVGNGLTAASLPMASVKFTAVVQID